MFDRFSALGSDFHRLLMSDALTLLALMVGQVAMPWWIASEGGARDLALYGAVTSAFALVAMPLLSPLGDRLPKRQLIFGALVAFTIASMGVAALASIHYYRLGVLIALGAVPALAMAALLPAVSSFSTELVQPQLLSRAMTLQQTAQATGRMVGPAIGGVVLGAVGTAITLWLNAALLACAAAAARHLPSGVRPHAHKRRWRVDLVAGMRANWRIPMERGWILVNFLSWIFLFPTFTILVPLKVQSLGLSGTWLGLCEAGLSLGMLLGSLGGSHWMINRFGRFGTRVGAAVVQGAALALAGLTTNGLWLVAGFVIAGFMNAAMVLVGLTHRMLARPQAYRARMVAGAVTTTHIAGMIGPALAGAALLHASVATVFTGFGLLGGIVALGLVVVPGFRAFMRLEHEAVDNFYGRNFPQAFLDAEPDPSLQCSTT
ncbi:MFS transporter [Niveibacterium microcysteis]|uniref:Multidrug efflux pump Tap n=1 Tax=Niveibacterium microcysteis TaxID=2811415 RepID=A0ABX7M0Q8_9RHOO|nr:MFS transporter [Niveibacterium microcysteis]QSI75345.1 MFS transporter [Niveibacterium microcysteis]